MRTAKIVTGLGFFLLAVAGAAFVGVGLAL